MLRPSIRVARVQTRNFFSWFKPTPQTTLPPALSTSIHPALAQKAERIKQVSLCPTSFERYGERVRPAFDCRMVYGMSSTSGEEFLSSLDQLSRLDEHSLQVKLDALFRRNLYTLAVSLAENAGMGRLGMAEVHRSYGDYLYQKGDFDGSMAQYTQTLEHIQPSYVIRKFLDAQRIHNLVDYLQALHSHGLANPDHTTLLLNCYTKSSDHTALDAFLKSETHRADQGDGMDDLPFDLDTAIRVCRQTGFFEHASYLAKRYGRHEEYLRIQIEDAEEWSDALRYLRGLGPEACQSNMSLYGRTLLQHVPDETTALLIDLCSGTLGQTPPQTASDGAKPGSTGPAVLSYLGYNRVAGMFTSEPTSSSPNDIAPHETRIDGHQSTTVTAQPSTEVPTHPATYTPPSPRQYFAHFVDFHDLFISYLEAVALTLWNQKVDISPSPTAPPSPPLINSPTYDPSPTDGMDDELVDQRAVWNTLFELYLSSARSSSAEVSSLARNKALGLIASSLPFDSMHALLLCSTAGFTEGTVRLWEKLGMYEDVLRFYMDSSRMRGSTSSSGSGPLAGNTDGDDGAVGDAGEKVLSALGLYGPDHPHLYPLVLRWLTSSPQILERHGDELPRILHTIDERRILPPLMVVQLLSRNGVASMGHVKEWLKGKVADGKQDIEADKSLVASYRSETAAKKATLVSLSSPTAPETFQASRCAACGAQLDLPAVHFMCKHSFHQRCLSDSEPECTLCARQHAIIREVRRNQTRLADRHELFLAEVEESDEGFEVVAGAFGRGLMGLRIEE